MRTILNATLIALFACNFTASARSAEDDAKSVVDKAIQAIGGEAKLGAAKGFMWKTKGTLRFGENENPYTAQSTISGLDQVHLEFEGEFSGNQFKAVTVLDGKKGWRKFGDTSMELSGDDLANEKRNVYLQAIPGGMLSPLKTADFKLELAGEEKVGDAETRVVKVTAPDGKNFKVFFDKTSNLPVKLMATVRGFMGEEFDQETLYSNFKDFDGVKKATKHVVKRDGMTFIEAEVTEFKLLDKVDPELFTEPK